MTRFASLLLLIPFFGCQQAATVPTLKPIVVDEAAAYPSQEPGTKPPILTGFTPLSKQQLDEGWVQLFDGVSIYGWNVSEGEGTLSVMTDGTKKYLVFDKANEGQATVTHCFCDAAMTCESDDRSIVLGSTKGWATHWDAASKFNITFDSKTGTLDATSEQVKFASINGLRAKPNNAQPLTETDWKPAAGESKAEWNDGVLTLIGGSGMVETVKEYGDFILQLEYFTEEGINSGVFFRCIPGEMMNGYECQIFNSPPDEDYKKFIGTDTGGIFRRQVGRNVGPKDGEWNYLTIAVRGADMATWGNGIQVTDWTEGA